MAGSQIFLSAANIWVDIATQTSKTYEKITIVRMIFASKLLSSFLTLAIYSFSSACSTDGHRETEVTLDMHSSGLDRLCVTHFLTLLHILWVLTQTLITTGLDQPTNRRVKLWRQVYPNFSAEPWWINCGFVFANSQHRRSQGGTKGPSPSPNF